MANSITIITVELEKYSIATGKNWLAYVASNPAIRIEGTSEDGVIRHMRTHLLSFIATGKRNVIELNFDEIMCEEVIEG